MAGSRKPAKSYGAGTPYPLRANPALKPGPKICPTHGNTAVGRPGRTVHMILSLTSSIGARAMRSRNPVLADLHIDGQVRKALLSANKNGFMYVIDRTNGKLIAAHPF